MSAEADFKVWVTLPGGEKIAHNAEAVEFEKECSWIQCHRRFRTEYLQQVYCSNECAKSAANHRYKAK